jgi:hypothetical protein
LAGLLDRPRVEAAMVRRGDGAKAGRQRAAVVVGQLGHGARCFVDELVDVVIG